jgi:hypothetical protein
MSTKSKNKKTNKNKSRKNSQKNKTNYYANYFQNTPLIPNSQILSYMKENFENFISLQKELEKKGKYPIYLDDCFEIANLFNTKERKFSFDSPINGKQTMSLDKLISYSFYLKTKFAFLNNNNQPTTEKAYLETLKYQMGKDIRRDNRTINGKEFKSELYADESKSNYKVADMFYLSIINIYNKFNKHTNFNIINKIALLSCQNMFNLITDMVTLKLNKLLEPEINSVFRPKKGAIITIEKHTKTIEYYFDSQLIISKDGGPIDPEYPCGNLKFKLLFDLNKNTFKFTQFILSYNINDCGPEELISSSVTSNQVEKPNNQDNNSYLKYSIPVVLGVGGIVATPFILGAIGGKEKKRKNKKNNHILYG